MAKLKVLKKKETRYPFRVFDNEKQPHPAICVFKRFPRPEETFYSGMQKNITDSLKIDAEEITKDKAAATKKIGDQIVKAFLDNLSAGRIDYEEFIHECIDHFEDFTDADTGKEIGTVNEFLSIPQEAMFAISRDCYTYATARDEFTLGE